MAVQCVSCGGWSSNGLFCSACEKESEQAGKVNKLKKGNTALLEALMDMCDQYLSDGDVCHHGFMTAGEQALKLLKNAGMASTVDSDVTYVLLYEELEKRKKELGIPSNSTPPYSTERYYKIIGKHTGKVIGVCTGDYRKAAQQEDPGCTFQEISKEQFDSFPDD